ncbi:MAG: hypothetical protein RIQ72_221 [Candidatus Parcubacteria bacterium]
MYRRYSHRKVNPDTFTETFWFVVDDKTNPWDRSGRLTHSWTADVISTSLNPSFHGRVAKCSLEGAKLQWSLAGSHRALRMGLLSPLVTSRSSTFSGTLCSGESLKLKPRKTRLAVFSACRSSHRKYRFE